MPMYQSPYETKLKEYEQRLAEIDKELLGKTEEIAELVDAETEELPSAKTKPSKCPRSWLRASGEGNQ